MVKYSVWTITSLIYASFTFVFFALEAAVMAYALELAFDIPPAWGYLVCALVVVVSVVSTLRCFHVLYKREGDGMTRRSQAALRRRRHWVWKI